MSNRTPDLAEIIAERIAANRKTMFGGWLPARIEKINADKTKASIQLLLLEKKESEAGTESLEPVAIINDCQIVTFTDHSGIRIELDLRVGDTVMAMFAARSTDRWRQRGGMIDPGDERDHDLNDAVVMPMLFDFAHATKPTAKIKFTATEIQAGGSDALAKASALTKLRTAITTAQAAQTIPNPPGASALGALGTALDAIIGWPDATSVLKGG